VEMISMAELKTIAKKFEDKLKKIKVIAFDIDGVLTDGTIHWDGVEVGFNRSSHTHDGYMMKVLMKAGLQVGVISGGDSIGVVKRFSENLGLSFIFLGDEDKRVPYKKLLERGFKDEEILYMGDEFFDIPLLKRAGFSATVSDACGEVKEIVDYVTKRSGGRAAAREVMDLVRYAQGIEPVVPDFE
jgi:3-deoxy-D-manno-octulosonate 8-phosphate phosphatase (KDO 8-P phosphatase)